MILACGALCACGTGGEAGGESTVTDRAAATAGIPADLLPHFTADSTLIRPEGWEGWVLAGTSIGLTYSEPARVTEPGAPPGNFLNVYMQPWAYERFLRTGEFPEGTMFILAGAEAVRKADPARGGFYQGDLSLMEVHLKRAGVHESGWGFYGFGRDDSTARLISADASCYSCHRDNTTHDNVFVQFYPALRDRLRAAADSPAASSRGET